MSSEKRPQDRHSAGSISIEKAVPDDSAFIDYDSLFFLLTRVSRDGYCFSVLDHNLPWVTLVLPYLDLSCLL